MKNSRKLGLVALVLFVMIMLVMVLLNKTVPKSQVEQDLMEETFLDIGRYVTSNEDIKNVKYLMTKELEGEKGFRDLYLPVAVHIENAFVKGDLYIDLFYEEMDDAWLLEDSYSVEEKLTFKSEIDTALLQAIIQENYSYMTIEEVRIESVDVDEENLEQYVEAYLVMNDGMIRYSESVGLDISYGKAWDEAYLWQIENYEMFESEEKLIAGADEEYFEEMLTGTYFDDWENGDEDYIYINDPLQITSLEVIEQETDLENFTDHVVLALTLAFENMTVEGTLDLSCYYEQGYGWLLDDVVAVGDARKEIAQGFDFTEDDVRKDLYGVALSYSFFRSVDIDENNLMAFSMDGVSYSEQGMYANVSVSLEVFDQDNIISGKATMTYALLEDGWQLSKMSRDGSLETMKFDDYKETLREITVNQVLASSVREPMGQYSYGPEHLIDHDVSTAWVEGAVDDGIGEWIEFLFEGEEHVQLIEFYLGYQSSYDRFYENLRPVGLTIIYSNGEETTYKASDERGAQYLYIKDSKHVKSIKIMIDETAGTDSYLDTCISDINFYSRP